MVLTPFTFRLQKRREKEREALGGARSAFDEDDVVDINDICTINVSGLRFQTRKSTLNRFPSTLLGSSDREKYINPKTSEYFFDRHRESFETILYFYQSNGLLCLPATLNPDIFIEEVRFFRLGDHILEKLCPDIISTKDIILPDHPLQRRVWQVSFSIRFSYFHLLYHVCVLSAFLSLYILTLIPIHFCRSSISSIFFVSSCCLASLVLYNHLPFPHSLP